jgi:putative transposase
MIRTPLILTETTLTATRLEIPRDIIVDDYATKKHLRVERWFATRPRFHLHFTPTYVSRLNQAEIWFDSNKPFAGEPFSSMNGLVEQIDH